MNTTPTNDNAAGKTGNSAEANKPIDFRKDTPPTDWLGKGVEERYGHIPPADIKTRYDFAEEFISELNELRCKPGCANGDGDDGSGGAYGQVENSQLASGQLEVRCVCSLLKEMTCTEAPIIPKGEFVAVVEAAGYSQEDTLEHYRNYAWTKLRGKREEELVRLITERENAHNWWVELSSWEANAQSTAAGNELRALRRQIELELEAIMSA